MNENIFRLAAGAMLISVFAISIYFRGKADRASGEKVSWKDEGLPTILALRLGGLVLWLSTLVYLINPAWMAWASAGLPDPVRWTGVGLGTACIALVYWVFSSIGSGITPTVATRREHQLVTHGPYRWVRHPLYPAATAFLLAFATAADNWFIALMAIFALVLLALRLPNEEAHLIEKFGDEYRQYMRRTGRFLPRLKSQELENHQLENRP
jgi:protein-S-isoprenylcysteine O-methyltransferase Ste14